MESTEALNLAWITLSAALVLFMQAGFCLLESGMSRAKNSINVAIKNLIDLCVSGLLFWVIGFGLMFGASNSGWIGTDGFGLAGYQDPKSLAFFLFQFVFCSTATTIISGATAERMSFRAYVVVAVLVSGLFYPVFGHWAWGGALGGSPGWLAKMGFVDFAGSTVVHSVGGWISLAAIIVLGPRLGRFPTKARLRRECKPSSMHGHDLGLATVGVFVLWFGWFGFNGGSTLAVDSRVPLILVNTNLAAAAGGVAAIGLTWLHEGRPVVSQLLVGVVAGLVSITAGCHIVSPWSAIVIGGIGGVAACGSTYLLARFRIDDVVGAVPAHAIAGVWGTLALALLAPPSLLPTGDRMTQFGVQLIGVSVAFAWSFGGSFVVFLGVNRFTRLRATARQEVNGLNFSEHGASTAMIDLAAEMHRHGITRQFNRLVHVDRFTEAGQIGIAYNRVLSQVSAEIARRDTAERQYRDIVENAVEGIFQTTPDGRFQSANPSLLDIYGDKTLLNLQQRISSLATQLYVDPTRRDEFKRLVAEQGVVRDFCSQVRRADGTLIWISESARAVKDQAGNLRYYEGTIVDISHRIDSERLHRERDFAEAASAAKSQFLARMSHEMRTPLGGVINSLDLITEDMPVAQRRKFIDIAKQSAHSLLSLINDVLDLSRIEAGKLDIEPVETDLQETVRIATEMIYHQARKKGLLLASHVSSDLPSHIWVDGGRLQQILVNLMGNAVKFTHSGEITVNVSRVDAARASARPKSETAITVRLEVADTGIGIAKHRLEKIFEVFTQADRSTTRRFGGSGLGLAICRQLAELMGGAIGVQARESGGTLFWLEFPAEPIVSTSNMATSCLEGRRVVVCAPQHVETTAMIAKLNGWGIITTHFDSIDEAASGVVGATRKNLSFELILIDSDFQAAWASAVKSRRLAKLAKLPLTWIGTPENQSGSMRSLDRPVSTSALLDEVLSLFSPPVSSQVVEPIKNVETVGSGQVVLIVDDNDVNRIIASEMVKRLGFETIAVESGSAAIEQLMSKKIGLVLMDCEMPEMDGLEATDRIRQLHRNHRLALPSAEPMSIIACTAQAVEGDRQRCLDAGMDYYVTKPIRREDLAASLRASLRTEPPICYGELLNRCGEDKQVVAEALRAFANRGTEDVKRVALAVNTSADETSAAAHRIKGAASSLAAHQLTRIADAIEDSARADGPHRKQNYVRSLKELEIEMNRCIRWIESLLESEL